MDIVTIMGPARLHFYTNAVTLRVPRANARSAADLGRSLGYDLLEPGVDAQRS